MNETNWAGNYRYRAGKLHRPSTVEQLQEVDVSGVEPMTAVIPNTLRLRDDIVTDGGMHHQLAASGNFGQVVRRNYPVAIASRFGAPGEEEVRNGARAGRDSAGADRAS